MDSFIIMEVLIALFVVLIVGLISYACYWKKKVGKKGKIIPVSVNYFFTRTCNYECGFCFHTAKTSYVAPLEDAKKALTKLAKKGMKKLNFSGGEPFMYPDFMGEICKFCKEELKLESVSIISNGSKITGRWFKKWGKYLDILAVSVDSFDEDTNVRIGRGKGKHLKQLEFISKWCREYGIMFKLNSVINSYNHLEDFTHNILLLEPFRWKCFQVLPVDTENSGTGALRDCTKFLISDEQFEDFCRRHEDLKCFVPESNRMMKSSYILMDEYLKFLSKGDAYSQTTRSVLDVDDIDELLEETDYEPDVFVERGGVFEWTRTTGCESLPPELEF